jgi:hypothetical protein
MPEYQEDKSLHISVSVLGPGLKALYFKHIEESLCEYGVALE